MFIVGKAIISASVMDLIAGKVVLRDLISKQVLVMLLVHYVL